MSCPHCQHKLTLREAIVLLHGSGWEQYAWVKTPDGATALVEVGLINPSTVEILEEDGRSETGLSS